MGFLPVVFPGRPVLTSSSCRRQVQRTPFPAGSGAGAAQQHVRWRPRDGPDTSTSRFERDRSAKPLLLQIVQLSSCVEERSLSMVKETAIRTTIVLAAALCIGCHGQQPAQPPSGSPPTTSVEVQPLTIQHASGIVQTIELRPPVWRVDDTVTVLSTLYNRSTDTIRVDAVICHSPLYDSGGLQFAPVSGGQCAGAYISPLLGPGDSTQHQTGRHVIVGPPGDYILDIASWSASQPRIAVPVRVLPRGAKRADSRLGPT